MAGWGYAVLRPADFAAVPAPPLEPKGRVRRRDARAEAELGARGAATRAAAHDMLKAVETTAGPRGAPAARCKQQSTVGPMSVKERLQECPPPGTLAAAFAGSGAR